MQYLILTCFPSFSEITSKKAGDSSKPYSVWIEHLNKESIKSDLLFNCALTYTYSPSSPFSTEVRWSLGAIGNLSIMFHLVTFMNFYDDTETAASDEKMRLRLRLCAYDQPQVSYNVVIGPSLLDFNLAGSTRHILTKPWTLDWLRFSRFPRRPPHLTQEARTGSMLTVLYCWPTVALQVGSEFLRNQLLALQALW